MFIQIENLISHSFENTPLPSSSMVHTVHRTHGVYDVHRLWKLMAGITPTKMKFNQVSHVLDSEMWTKTDTGVPFSPMELIHTRVVKDTSHWNRVFNADLKFPIIILDQDAAPHEEVFGHKNPYKWAGQILGRYDCLDGLHRLSKLWLLDAEEVNVIIIPWTMLQEAKLTATAYNLMLLAAFFGYSVGTLMWTAVDWSKAYGRTSLNASIDTDSTIYSDHSTY